MSLAATIKELEQATSRSPNRTEIARLSALRDRLAEKPRSSRQYDLPGLDTLGSLGSQAVRSKDR